MERTTKISLLLKSNAEEDRRWDDIIDLSGNAYAMGKLHEITGDTDGKRVLLSSDILQALLLEAQNTSHGFSMVCGTHSYGQTYRRKVQAYDFATALNRALCDGRSVYYVETSSMDLSFPDFGEDGQ